MGEPLNPVASLANLQLTRQDRGPGLVADRHSVTKALGLTMLGASYYEVEPGNAGSPYHVHYQEDELIILLEGEGVYRFGGTEYPVKAGDVLSAPAGDSDYAHQLTNTGDKTLKYICVSNLPDFNIVQLPEIGVVRIFERKDGGRHHEAPLTKPEQSK